MDAATFYTWLVNHFILNIPPARQVVLLVDSTDAHLDLDTFELAKKNQVYIFALLKNATHLVQPANVGLFGLMQQSWYKHIRRFSQKNPNMDITKKNFCAVFKSTWQEVMRPSILSEAFRKSGLYPVCRQQISNVQVQCSLVYASTSTSTGTVDMPSLSSEPRSFTIPEQSESFEARPIPLIQTSVCSTSEQSESFDARPIPLIQTSACSTPEQSVSFDARPIRLIQSSMCSTPEQSESFDARPIPLIQTSVCSIPEQSVSSDARPIHLTQSSKFSSPQLNASLNTTSLPFKERDCSVTMKNALDALESVLETPVKVRYRRWVEEGYNLDGRPTFQAWKKLHTGASQALDPAVMTPQVINQHPPILQPTPIVHAADTNTQNLPIASFPELAVSPVLVEILTYPSAPDGSNPKSTNVKRTLPNFLNSDASTKSLWDAKLKRARELAAKQKKLR